MPNGYNGKILHVHLDKLTLEVEQPEETFYQQYLGGSALGLHYVLKHTPKNCDPLGPENTLVLALSVLTGVAVSGQSRMTAVAKSPLTGAIGDSQGGGFFPAEMKFSGFDAVVLHGKSDKPVYLLMKDGEAQLKPAEHLWGKDTAEVEDLLIEELGDKRVQILQTGIAGENLVSYAALISMKNRANGRTGMGAVMASKNLKAVVVRGKNRPVSADADTVKKVGKWGADNFVDSDIHSLGLYGTAEVLSYQHEDGGLPTKNWDSGVFDNYLKIDGVTMAETILKERDTCYACTVRCKRVVEVAEGDYLVDPKYGGPEYETLATFGSYCLIDNLEAVSLANQLCNRYGLDTISCGATIAWAMDCFDKGLLTKADTGGVELKFGNADAMLTMVEQIARVEGFGAVLAKGSRQAASQLGIGEELVVAIKGQELPAHMPEVKRSLALIYAVNPFGADHQSSEHDGSYADYPERMAQIGLEDSESAEDLNAEKVRYALTTQKLYSTLDSLNMCQFVFGPAWQLFDSDQLLELTNAVTGWNLDMEELLKVGERRINMMRVFNAREGLTRTNDHLPEKLFSARKGGPSDGISIGREELETAKDVYYQLAGWDADSGAPTKETLSGLDLAWTAALLEE
jgi:aldehyde:ferredoxin oxidoreductase